MPSTRPAASASSSERAANAAWSRHAAKAAASRRATGASSTRRSTGTGASRRRAPSPLAPRRRRSGGIRWDRVGRTALLVVLGVIVLLYIPPVTHWIEQRQTSGRQQAEVEELQREQEGLRDRIDSLTGRAAIEREARNLGMVREGERAIVVDDLPED